MPEAPPVMIAPVPSKRRIAYIRDPFVVHVHSRVARLLMVCISLVDGGACLLLPPLWGKVGMGGHADLSVNNHASI
jgi:hypothetical protein